MRSIFILLFSLLTVQLCAQTTEKKEKTLEPIRWIIKPSVHVIVPFTTGNSPAEKLISYNGAQVNFTVVAIARYFDHWGIETELYVGSRVTDGSAAFRQALLKEFGDRYYISSSTLSYFDETSARFMIGPGYKNEHGRIFYTYRLMIGVMSYYAPTGNVALKAINSNERRTISWRTADDDPSAFAVSSAFTIGYRVNRHFSLTANVGLWLNTSNVVYTEYTTVLNESNVTARTLSYDAPRLSASFGLGMAFSW